MWTIALLLGASPPITESQLRLRKYLVQGSGHVIPNNELSCWDSPIGEDTQPVHRAATHPPLCFCTIEPRNNRNKQRELPVKRRNPLALSSAFAACGLRGTNDKSEPRHGHSSPIPKINFVSLYAQIAVPVNQRQQHLYKCAARVNSNTTIDSSQIPHNSIKSLFGIPSSASGRLRI